MDVFSRAQSVDVLIVGAGPAGASTALALIRAGVSRVVLAEQFRRRSSSIGESAAPGVGPVLRRLGLPDDLEELGHRPYYGNVSMWGDSQYQVDDFLSRGVGHGWHLDRRVFDRWLQSVAVERGAGLIAPAEIRAITPSGSNGWEILLRRGERVEEIRASVVVDATGRCAAVATRLGARRYRLDNLIALTTTTESRFSGGGMLGYCLVATAEDGWWHAASLRDGSVAVTLMTDHEVSKAKCLRSPAAFHRAWTASRKFGDRVSPPADHDLAVGIRAAATQYIDCTVGRGWLAVGDALIALDPLTSSGITGALEDGLWAARTIVHLLAGRDSPEALAAADEYAIRAQRIRHRYLAERHRVYAQERYWADRPFWQRRIAAGSGRDLATLGHRGRTLEMERRFST
jgi:flavin-dependent dehydrogenase